MSQITEVARVGAGLDAAQIKMSYQLRALKEQQNVAKDLGSAALTLIQTAMSATATGQSDLDVRA